MRRPIDPSPTGERRRITSRAAQARDALHGRLARELVRALRGRRSQAALSRRMRFESNVLYRWEAGLRAPSIEELLRLARSVGIDVRAALVRFDDRLGKALPPQLSDARFVPALLETLWSGSVAELARRVRIGPSSLSRFLSGRARLKLPMFFTVLEAITGRLLDWISVFVDPAALPAARKQWERLVLARDAAQTAPNSEAMLALVETQGYRAHADHPDGWIASLLGISEAEERQTFEVLRTLGWVHRDSDSAPYEVTPARDIDTRALPPSAYRRLREHWVRQTLRGFATPTPPLVSYVVFSTSEERLARIREVLLDTYHRLREILREDEPRESITRAALATLSVLPLDGRELPPRS